MNKHNEIRNEAKSYIKIISNYTQLHDELLEQGLDFAAGWVQGDILRAKKALENIMNLYIKGDVELDGDIATSAHELLNKIET